MLKVLDTGSPSTGIFPVLHFSHVPVAQRLAQNNSQSTGTLLSSLSSPGFRPAYLRRLLRRDLPGLRNPARVGRRTCHGLTRFCALIALTASKRLGKKRLDSRWPEAVFWNSHFYWRPRLRAYHLKIRHDGYRHFGDCFGNYYPTGLGVCLHPSRTPPPGPAFWH
jgi:hypothetical protein